MVNTEFLDTATEGLSIGLATPTPEVLLTPNIGVIGVGGAGGNAVNNMVTSELQGVSFYAANTDAQALSKSLVSDRIQLGVAITQGLGAGANPEVGRAAAEETADKIKEYLQGLHLLFITAGMGGGTGTGAAPVIAKIAKEMGIMTVGVVSKPFRFEGFKRMRTADAGIAELKKSVDTLIVIPNQNLFRIVGDNTTVAEAFQIADSVLCQGVRSITDLVMNPGLINLDFADVKTVISTMGRAMMGTGEASGENRAMVAVEKAISNPLLDDSSVKGAKSILINISGGLDLTLSEVDMATERIIQELDPNANIIFGTCTDEKLHGTMRVSLVATGIERGPEEPVVPTEVKRPTPETIVSVPPVAEPAAPIKVPETLVEEQPQLIQTTVLVAKTEETLDSAIVRKTTDIAIEVAERPLEQPPLFADDTPVVPAAIPVNTVPDTQIDIDLESKKGDANVKAPRQPFGGLFPGFMGGKPVREKKQVDEQPAQTDDPFEQLPAFLRRR